MTHYTWVFLKPISADKSNQGLERQTTQWMQPLLKLEPVITLMVYELAEPDNRVALLDLVTVFSDSIRVCGRQWDRICRQHNNLYQITNSTGKKPDKPLYRQKSSFMQKIPQFFSLYSNCLTHISSLPTWHNETCEHTQYHAKVALKTKNSNLQTFILN